MAANKGYSAKDIKRLEGLEHVRHRVGMYLGGNSSEGLTTALREIIDNSADEALAGNGKEIRITFFQDGSAEVQDFGRGLPVDTDDQGISGIELALGNIGAGGKFDSDNYKVSGGLNGVGAAATNATSVRFDVTVYRDGKKHELSFKQGKPGHFAKPNDPDAKFTPGHDLKVSKDTRTAAERKANPTGTTIRFWPDFTIFMPDSKFMVDDIKFRVKSTAFLVPGLKFVVVDGREDDKHPVVEEYHFEGGLADMLPTVTGHSFVTKPIHLTTESSFTETRNILQPDGTAKRGEVERHVDIEVAFGFVNYEDTVLKSYVNLIQTHRGGTHESGLWRALSRIFINYIKNTRGLLKAKEEPPVLEDVRDGFVGVISVKFPEPTFTGQEKSTLATQQMTSVVSQAVGAELQKWIENKKNAKQVREVAQKIVEASRIRLAAKQQKDLARRKTALQGASMPAKLVDCSETGTEFTELLICEGDSALGTLKAARDSRYQALLPIRGKILNVHKASPADILKNKEVSDIIQVVGAGSGKSFDPSQMRVSRVIMTADADVDGAHITILLTTMFYRLMRPMIEQGRLYTAVPPLYIIKVAGKNGETFYAENDAEKDKIVARLEKQGKKLNPLRRLKGLGEVPAETFWQTTLNPETRTLRRVTLEEAEMASHMLDLAMGSEVAPRKEWIMNSRDKLSEVDLDI